MEQIFELTPTNGRKSFNNKAKVIVENGIARLLSYQTIVAGYNIETKEHEQQEEKSLSLTTKSHIKAFKNFYGI